jgi:hypothetical protein
VFVLFRYLSQPFSSLKTEGRFLLLDAIWFAQDQWICKYNADIGQDHGCGGMQHMC